jgi:hypothetical protein
MKTEISEFKREVKTEISKIKNKLETLSKQSSMLSEEEKSSTIVKKLLCGFIFLVPSEK